MMVVDDCAEGGTDGTDGTGGRGWLAGTALV